METVDLEVLLRRRATRRQRLLHASATASVALVALALVARAVVWRAATPPAGPSSAVDVVPTITTNVSFGALEVNGTPVQGAWPITTRLRTGRNAIRLDAPPFLPVSCSLPWPLDPHLLSGPTGSYTRAGPAPAPPRALGADACDFTWGSAGGAISAVEIDLPVTGADLPPALRGEALSALARTLAHVTPPTTTVGAGAYYATGLDARGQTVGRIAEASLVEWATLTPDPAGDAVFKLCGDLGCPGAFEAGIGSAVGAPTGRIETWSVGEAVRVTLHFATASGRELGAVPMPLGVAIGLTLEQGPDGTWRAGGPLAEGATPQEASALWPQLNLCSEGLQLLRAQLKPAGAWALPQDAVGADGCRLQAGTYEQGAAGASQWAPSGEFLWQFGVLLALDGSAHRLLPTLPMAPAGEAGLQAGG